MTFGELRTRSMLVPNPYGVGNLVQLGRFEAWNSSLQKWEPTNVGQDSFDPATLGYPASKWKVTRDVNHGHPPYLVGGPFKSFSIEAPQFSKLVWGNGTYVNANGTLRYIGGFQPPAFTDFGWSLPDWNFHLSFGLNSPAFPNASVMYGEAYNKTKPQLEQVSGAVFLAEARDIPRMLRTSSRLFHDIWKDQRGDMNSWKQAPKKVSDQFLNLQFGWIPFLSDIRKLYNTFDQSTAIIRRLSNENGQWVRRRAILKSSTESTTIYENAPVGFFWPNAFMSSPFTGIPWMSGPARATLYRDLIDYVVASGKYRYYRPEFDRGNLDQDKYWSPFNAVRRYLTIFGLRINPANLYKATPWTWAADWISNTGDLIDRANDELVDSVASKYLFLSYHRRYQWRLHVEVPMLSNTISANWTLNADLKQREEAQGPYGFDLTLANLTPRQIAIAGALGLSRESFSRRP